MIMPYLGGNKLSSSDNNTDLGHSDNNTDLGHSHNNILSAFQYDPISGC